MTGKFVVSAAALVICCCSTSQAITNSAIAVSGTNIILSWPSFGYESYLVQYRQTLNPDDSWSCLTNAYHANSTNRTTLTLYGAVTESGGNGGSFTAMTAGESAYDSMAAGPLAVPVDVTIGGSKDWGTVDRFWEFRKDWMAEWAGIFQEPLDLAFDQASIFSGWVDGAHYSHLKRYGYTTMLFFQYNFAGQWP